jgi:hypothetical protein
VLAKYLIKPSLRGVGKKAISRRWDERRFVYKIAIADGEALKITYLERIDLSIDSNALL